MTERIAEIKLLLLRLLVGNPRHTRGRDAHHRRLILLKDGAIVRRRTRRQHARAIPASAALTSAALLVRISAGTDQPQMAPKATSPAAAATCLEGRCMAIVS